MVHFNAALLLYRHKNLDDSRLQIVISKASLRVSYKNYSKTFILQAYELPSKLYSTSRKLNRSLLKSAGGIKIRRVHSKQGRHEKKDQVKLLALERIKSYLRCLEAPSTHKPTSKNFLIAQNTITGILILVKKLLESLALLTGGRHVFFAG